MDYKQFVEVSERLVFSSEFQQLQKRLEFAETNLWHILQIGRREDCVTRFLAWLMNPKADHGQGDLLLKAFVIEAVRSSPKLDLPSPVQISVADFSSAIVEDQVQLSGHRRCDLLITSQGKSREKGKGWLFLVENKVAAKEALDQTSDYYHLSLERYPVAEYPERIYLFLSPDGTPARCAQFITVSYETLLTAIAQARSRCTFSETVGFLVREFEETIRRYVAMDRETLDLAQAVYEAHRGVIDFIYENSAKTSKADTAGDEEWDGKTYFFNIGETGEYPYAWNDCRQYGFICAVGGPRYEHIMQRFKRGDVIYAYVSNFGYVGVGSVQSEAVPFSAARLADGTSLLDLKNRGELEGVYDPHPELEKRDWVVLIQWNPAANKTQAVREAPVHVGTCARFYAKWHDLMERIHRGLQRSSAAAATTP